MDHQNEVNDSELSDLLESTLGDFFKPSAGRGAAAGVTSSHTSGNPSGSSSQRTFGQLPGSSGDPFDQLMKEHMTKCDKDRTKGSRAVGKTEQLGEMDEAAEKVKQRLDDIMNDFIEKEPHLKEQWQKLSELTNAPDDEAFETWKETLKNLTESAKSVVENQEDISDEEMSRLWNKLGVSEDGNPNEEGLVPEVFSLVTNMMQNLLSKQVLYPSIKDLTERYPVWIEEHRSELAEEDLERYTKQLNLMEQVCVEFESESDSDSSQVKDARFQKILKIMQEMKDCGSPPKDVVGDVPDIGSDLDFSKFSEMTGGSGGPAEQGCSLM